MEIKVTLYNHCLQDVQTRIARLKEEMLKVQSSANQETKSSAGDKYETGRAMAQQEVDFARQQLIEAEKLEQALLGIHLDNQKEIVSLGSLVATSRGIFFIAISIGMVTIDANQYFVISPESPIGKLLLGKKVGESIIWNDLAYGIHSIE